MRILVVEDEFLIAIHLEDMLGELGYTDIHIARDLDEGWSVLESITPDFAILDVNIGAALVFPLASELLRRKVPFVFSTGRGLGAFPPEWRAFPLVPKPLETRLLVAAMQDCGLRRRQTPEGD